MSIDELLKDSNGSSTWKEQRRRLIRIIIGISVISIAFIVGISFLFLMKNSEAPESDPVQDQAHDINSMTELIRLQRETQLLREQLIDMKENSSKQLKTENSPDRKIASTPQGHFSSRPTRVISFDPGEGGFTNLETETPSLYIPTGAVFQAQLITPIKTSIERTFVMAETIHEFRMDMDRKIPQGSRLIGRARLNPILKGVVVEFETLVLPSGIETQVRGLALSRNALPEIEGIYFSDRLETYGTALAFGFLSGFADASRVRSPTLFGPQVDVNLNNQILAGLSTASFQVAEELLRDIRTSAIEYVVVPAGEQVFVALTQRYDIYQGESRP